MTINQMRCFSMVTKELNFAKAAKLLYVSQPAVTHQIRMLENELGVQLFRRTSRSVRLTPAGIALFQEVDDILGRIEQVSRRAIRAADSPAIHIGCVSMLSLPQFLEICREFRKLEPEVMINMTDVPHFDYQGMLSSQQLDIVFTPKELISRVPELNYLRIKKDRLYCVVPEGHRLENRESVSCPDLEGETVIMLDTRNCPPLMAQVQQLISSQTENILINYSSSSGYTCPMVLGGVGIGVMPGFVIPELPGIRKVPFVLDDPLQDGFEYGLAYHQGTLSRAQRSFMRVVKELLCE